MQRLPFSSTGELAVEIGVQTWHIARLFELGVLPEPPRVAGRRVIDRAIIPEIIEALVQKGWLPAQSLEEASLP